MSTQPAITGSRVFTVPAAGGGGGITGVVICEANTPTFNGSSRLYFDTFYDAAGNTGVANTLLAPLGLSWDPTTYRFVFSTLTANVIAEFLGQLGYSASGWVDSYFGDTGSPNLSSEQTFLPGSCTNPSVSSLFPIVNLCGVITPVSSVLKYFSAAARYAGTWTNTANSSQPFQYATLKLTGLS